MVLKQKVLLPFSRSSNEAEVVPQAQRLRKEQPEKYAKAWAPLERRDNSPKALLQQTIVKPFRILSMEPILMVTTVRSVIFVCSNGFSRDFVSSTSP